MARRFASQYRINPAMKKPAVPPITSGVTARTPVDAFLAAAMPTGLAFSPEAERLTLLVRASFDLTGYGDLRELLVALCVLSLSVALFAVRRVLQDGGRLRLRAVEAASSASSAGT